MSAYRFNEWQDYIEKQNIIKKNSDTVIVILAFNQLQMVQTIAKFYSIQKVDILFVDNNSSDRSYEFLKNNFAQKFNVIRTKENIGGAGGFALGQEWAINKKYEYCILTEEDALPLDDTIVIELLKYKDINTRVRAKFYELNQPSFSLHFNLYPTWVFEKIGVLNKKLFFRSDDWEYEQKLQKYFNSKPEFKTTDIDQRYSHPLIKKGFGVMANYFATRNGLIVHSRYSKKNKFFDITRIVIKDLWNAFFNFFYDKQTMLLKQFKDAVWDALNLNFSNADKVEKFKSNKIEPYDYNFQELSMDEFLIRYKKYKLKNELLSKSLIKDKFSNVASGVVTGKYNSASRVLAFFSKKIIFIEEIDFIKKSVVFIEYDNNRAISVPLLLLSLGVSFSIAVFLIPYLLIKLKK